LIVVRLAPQSANCFLIQPSIALPETEDRTYAGGIADFLVTFRKIEMRKEVSGKHGFFKPNRAALGGSLESQSGTKHFDVSHSPQVRSSDVFVLRLTLQAIPTCGFNRFFFHSCSVHQEDRVSRRVVVSITSVAISSGEAIWQLLSASLLPRRLEGRNQLDIGVPRPVIAVTR
jgi:hypothetical protein